MFEKGHKKLGGRKKGSKNKNTLLKVDEVLLNANINPIEKLIEIAESKETSSEQQIRCWIEIVKYCYPRFKSLEPPAEQKQNIDTIEIRLVNPDGSYEKL